MYDQKPKIAEIDSVRYYFDGVRTDSLDASGVSRRNGELLALRAKLMELSELEFEVTMKALWGVVSGARQDAGDDGMKKPSYNDAKRLYSEARPADLSAAN